MKIAGRLDSDVPGIKQIKPPMREVSYIPSDQRQVVVQSRRG
jgi:hypothetical protein